MPLSPCVDVSVLEEQSRVSDFRLTLVGKDLHTWAGAPVLLLADWGAVPPARGGGGAAV